MYLGFQFIDGKTISIYVIRHSGHWRILRKDGLFLTITGRWSKTRGVGFGFQRNAIKFYRQTFFSQRKLNWLKEGF